MIAWQVLLLPLAIDVVTCVLGVIRNRRPAPSGFPGVTLVLYAWFIFIAWEAGVALKLLAMSAAVLLHGLLVFAVPALDNRYLRRTP